MRIKKRINNIKLGRALRVAARQNGISQAVLSNKIGINQSQVSRILSGKFSKTSKSVNALCILLKVTKTPTEGVVSLSNYPELSFCLAEFLDGTRRREKAIVRLLRSARSLS